MLKLWGSLMILLGCGYWGWSKGDKLQEKVALTGEFIHTLYYVKREITQKHREVPVLLKKIAKRDKGLIGKYFQSLWLTLSSDGESSFREKWTDIYQEDFALPEDLLHILSPLEDCLGQFSACSQGETLDSIIKELQALQEKQEAETRNMLRVYRALGITVGLFLVILFL